MPRTTQRSAGDRPRRSCSAGALFATKRTRALDASTVTLARKGGRKAPCRITSGGTSSLTLLRTTPSSEASTRGMETTGRVRSLSIADPSLPSACHVPSCRFTMRPERFLHAVDVTRHASKGIVRGPFVQTSSIGNLLLTFACPVRCVFNFLCLQPQSTV